MPDEMFPDPTAPRARRSDPDTSHEAAASVRSITDKQAAIVRLLERLGGQATDASIGDAYLDCSRKWPSLYPRQSPSGARTRRFELFRLGLVVDTGERRVLPTGRKAIVWGLAPGVRSEGLRRG